MVSFSSHANPSENKHYKDYFEHDGAIEHIATESPKTHNYYFDSGAYISSENAFFGWNGVTVETGRTVYIQFGKAPESENLDYDLTFAGSWGGVLIEGAHYGDDGEAELQIIGDGKGSVKFVDTSNDSDRANVWINVQGKLSVSNVVNFYATGDTGSALRIDDDAEANIAISGDFKLEGAKKGIYAENGNYDSNTQLTVSANSIDISTLDQRLTTMPMAGLHVQTSTVGNRTTMGVTMTASDKLSISGLTHGVLLNGSSNTRLTGSNKVTLAAKGEEGIGVYLYTDASFDKRLFQVETAELELKGSAHALYADGYEVNAFANSTTVTGQTYALDGADVVFDSLNKDGSGSVEIAATEQDAVIAASDVDGTPTQVTFKQTTTINSQGDEIYHAELQGVRTDSAIRAYRNSVVTLDKASGIYGDVIAGQGIENGTLKGGEVVITSTEGAAFKGDYLTGNGGSITLTLNGATTSLEGRIDNYADVTLEDAIVHRPKEFDVSVKTGGTVDLTLNGATWTARGQSFVTTLAFGDEGGIVDMTKEQANSVSISTLTGNGTFKMLLNAADHSMSDMLYIRQNTGTQTIEIVNGIEGGLENITADNPLRFATITTDQGNPEVDGVPEVRAYTRDAGVWNLEYSVEKEAFDPNDPKNEAYNGKGDGKGVNKPGNDFVEQVLAQGEDTVNWIITTANGRGDEDSVSDAGQTILATARGTYAAAVELDRFDVRYGDRKYSQEQNGVWMRVRHDRLATDAGVGDYDAKKTMYQVGYDFAQQLDAGKMLWGAALDWMDADVDYIGIRGEGSTDRVALSLYGTLLKDNGAYFDFIAKAGRLSNDFETWTPSGTKVTGDYDNWMFRVSGEVGHKLENGTDWFVEPQAQVQYVYVTGKDYRTTQTRVDQDDIDSLITRVGFRVGKTLSESKNAVIYAKSDVVREWMGEQKMRVFDNTTASTGDDFSIQNKGTWFDVGAGFQTELSKDAFAFADVEYRFGNDWDDSWSFNVGGRWMF